MRRGEPAGDITSPRVFAHYSDNKTVPYHVPSAVPTENRLPVGTAPGLPVDAAAGR